MAVDPTKVRVSDRLLLSELLGCHSVYALGHPNVWSDPDGSKLREAKYLAEKVLEPVLDEVPITVSYGYISLALARKIVTYQSPEKPSYHQWNDGAAVDIMLHDTDNPPVATAAWLDSTFPMSRTITYAESPYLCVGTRSTERTPRRALYENRYVGVRKPQYISYPQPGDTRTRRLRDAVAYVAEHGWKGAGHPTYHGGGIKQLHHVRVSKYTMLSDYLYARDAVHKGYRNALSMTDTTVKAIAPLGRVYDAVLDALDLHRLSIVKGYESPKWSDDVAHTWKDTIQIVVVCPSGVNPNDVADAAYQHGATVVAASTTTGRVTIGVPVRHGR